MINLVKHLFTFLDHFFALLITTYVLLTAWVVVLSIGNVDVNSVFSYSTRAMGLLVIVVSTYSLVAGYFELRTVKLKGERMVQKGIAGIVVVFFIYLLASEIANHFGPAVQTQMLPQF